MKTNRFWTFLYYSAGGAIIVLGTAIACFFRDGFGPDAIQTHGSEAALRVLEGSWLYVLVGVVFIVLGYRVNKRT